MDEQFTATLQKSSNKGAWAYVVWAESVEFFRTRGLVKVRGRIDRHPFRSSFMARGDGTQCFPSRQMCEGRSGRRQGTPSPSGWKSGSASDLRGRLRAARSAGSRRRSRRPAEVDER